MTGFYLFLDVFLPRRTRFTDILSHQHLLLTGPGLHAHFRAFRPTFFPFFPIFTYFQLFPTFFNPFSTCFHASSTYGTRNRLTLHASAHLRPFFRPVKRKHPFWPLLNDFFNFFANIQPFYAFKHLICALGHPPYPPTSL